jgi:hypothetical protein
MAPKKPPFIFLASALSASRIVAKFPVLEYYCVGDWNRRYNEIGLTVRLGEPLRF